MSIYYYGELIGVYNPKPKTNSSVTLVGDVIKSRPDYDKYAKPKTKFKIWHYQDGVLS